MRYLIIESQVRTLTRYQQLRPALKGLYYADIFKWRKILYFDSDLTNVGSERSNWQYVFFGSINGLVSKTWQAIWPVLASIRDVIWLHKLWVISWNSLYASFFRHEFSRLDMHCIHAIWLAMYLYSDFMIYCKIIIRDPHFVITNCIND